MARKSKKVAPIATLRWDLATGAAHREAARREREPDRSRGGCGGSHWVYHFGTDYPCGGCTGCDRFRCLTVAFTTAAELESKTWARALSAIGAAVAAALLPGLALESLIASSIVAWNTPGTRGPFTLTASRIGAVGVS